MLTCTPSFEALLQSVREASVTRGVEELVSLRDRADAHRAAEERREDFTRRMREQFAPHLLTSSAAGADDSGTANAATKAA